jgi:hypothetical protein
MALLGVRLQLGLQGRELGKRRIGVGLLLALPALRRFAPVIGVVAVIMAVTLVLPVVRTVVVLAMVLAVLLAILGESRRPFAGRFGARIGSAVTGLARFGLVALAEFPWRTTPAAMVTGLLGLGSRFRRHGGRLGTGRLGGRRLGGRHARTLSGPGWAVAAAVLTARRTARTAALLAPTAGSPHLDEFGLSRSFGNRRVIR